MITDLVPVAEPKTLNEVLELAHKARQFRRYLKTVETPSEARSNSRHRTVTIRLTRPASPHEIAWQTRIAEAKQQKEYLDSQASSAFDDAKQILPAERLKVAWDILEWVARRKRVHVWSILSQSRALNHIEARMLSIRMICHHPMTRYMSVNSIGKLMNNRHHTTIMSAISGTAAEKYSGINSNLSSTQNIIFTLRIRFAGATWQKIYQDWGGSPAAHQRWIDDIISYKDRDRSRAVCDALGMSMREIEDRLKAVTFHNVYPRGGASNG